MEGWIGAGEPRFGGGFVDEHDVVGVGNFLCGEGASQAHGDAERVEVVGAHEIQVDVAGLLRPAGNRHARTAVESGRRADRGGSDARQGLHPFHQIAGKGVALLERGVALG